MNQKAETRRLVQNRYQHQINELNIKVEELTNQLTIKECENKLFKENINSTQIQLQEKSAMITDLTEQINQLTHTHEVQHNELQDQLVKLRGELEDIHIKHSELINEHDELKNQTSNRISDNDNLYNRFQELSQKYDVLLSNFNTRTLERDSFAIKIGEIQQELNLKSESVVTLENNLVSIKQEMETITYNNLILVQEITEKDTYLKELSAELEQLKLSQQMVQTVLSQPPPKVPPKVPQQVKYVDPKKMKARK